METATKLEKPSVFEYEDYRQFLNDLYVYYKNTTTYFSYRYFSQRAGFKSPNFLKLVIDGQRNLTEKSVDQVAMAFRFSKAEGEYFKHLVMFCQSRNKKQKTDCARLLSKAKTSFKTHSLKQAQMKYYSHWYYIPLRELIGTSSFCENLTWICEQFLGEVSEKQISEAIEDLLILKLVERNDLGHLRLTHQHIATPGEVMSSLVVGYHLEMIERGGEAIASYSPEHREVSGTCIPCSEESVGKIKSLIQDFRKEVVALTDSQLQSDRVYQLNFQFFPMTGVSRRGKC